MVDAAVEARTAEDYVILEVLLEEVGVFDVGKKLDLVVHQKLT